MNSLQKILTLVGVFVFFALIYGFSMRKQSHTRFSEVKINLLGAEDLQFVSPSLLKKLLTHDGNYIQGQVVDSVNVATIEQRVIENPFVKDAEAFVEIDGVFHIEVEPRVPIARIVNVDGTGFYLDEDGYTMPTSDQYTAKVIPCTGLMLDNIYNHDKVFVDKEAKLKDVWQVAKAIGDDAFLAKQFVQLDMNKDGEIVLIPRVGNHEVKLGKAINIETKFNNLKAFYEKGIEQSNWNIYKLVDLSFDGQIVCKKR